MSVDKNMLRREMLLSARRLFFIQAVPTFRRTCFTGQMIVPDKIQVMEPREHIE